MMTLLLLQLPPAGFTPCNVPPLAGENQKTYHSVRSLKGKLSITVKGQDVPEPEDPRFENKQWIRCYTAGNYTLLVRGEGEPFQGGELFPVDHGEFGGAVVYIDSQGNRTEILEDPVAAIGIKGETIYALTSYGHRSLTYSKIFCIRRKGYSWHAKQMAKFDFYISFGCWNGEGFTVGGFTYGLKREEIESGIFKEQDRDHFEELSLTGKRKKIASFDFTNRRICSIAVLPDKTIWLGGYNFIASYRSNSRPREWQYFVKK